MKQCTDNCSAAASNEGWMGDLGPRFPDMKHRFKIRWKDALGALLGPAERLHHLRSLRTAMFYDAMAQRDKASDDE